MLMSYSDDKTCVLMERRRDTFFILGVHFLHLEEIARKFPPQS